MIAKKNPKFQEGNNRGIYFQLGILITGTSLLMAFTWKTPVNKNYKSTDERIAEVPTIEVVKEKVEKPIEIPKVEKQQPQKSPDPITVKALTAFINPIDNKDKNEKVDVKHKLNKGDIVGLGGDIDDLGDPPKLDEVVKFPDREAKFNGNWKQFLSENVVYPAASKEWGDQGAVHVSFVVEKDGSVTDVDVLNKERVTKELQEEAIRVVKSSPNWVPGTLNGEYVRSYANVKINFILE
ncbi:MAG: TonB family protein [Brumimicrobium sp.]